MKVLRKGWGRRITGLFLTAVLLFSNSQGLTQLGLGTIVVKAEDDAPFTSAVTEGIKAATLNDTRTDGKVGTLYTGDTYTIDAGTGAWDDAKKVYTKEMAIKATALVRHQNADSPESMGYWIGYFIPESVLSIKTGEEGAEDEYVATAYAVSYTNPANNQEASWTTGDNLSGLFEEVNINGQTAKYLRQYFDVTAKADRAPVYAAFKYAKKTGETVASETSATVVYEFTYTTENVTLTKAITGVTLASDGSVTAIPVGGELTLTATPVITGTAGEDLSNPELSAYTWSSVTIDDQGNETTNDFVTINESGKITGAKEGSTTIKAVLKSDASVSGTYNLEVKKASVKPTFKVDSKLTITLSDNTTKEVSFGTPVDGVYPLKDGESDFTLKTGQEVTKIEGVLNTASTIANDAKLQVAIKAKTDGSEYTTDSDYGTISLTDGTKITIVPKTGENSSTGMAAFAADVKFTLPANVLTDASTDIAGEAATNDKLQFSMKVAKPDAPALSEAKAYTANTEDGEATAADESLTQGTYLSKIELSSDTALALARTSEGKTVLEGSTISYTATKGEDNDASVTISDAVPVVTLSGDGKTVTISFQKPAEDTTAAKIRLVGAGTFKLTLPEKTVFDKSTANTRLEDKYWVGNASQEISFTVSAPAAPEVKTAKYKLGDAELTDLTAGASKYTASITAGDTVSQVVLSLNGAIAASGISEAGDNGTYTLKGKSGAEGAEETTYGTMALTSGDDGTTTATITMDDAVKTFASSGLYTMTIPAKAFANSILDGVDADYVTDASKLSDAIQIVFNVAPAEAPIIESVDLKKSDDNKIETTLSGYTISADLKQGDEIASSITFTMKKNVALVGNAADSNKVYMTMLQGTDKDKFQNVEYGTFSITDNRISVTPTEGNTVCGWAGVMQISVPAKTIKNVDNNAANEDPIVFILSVEKVDAPAAKELTVARQSPVEGETSATATPIGNAYSVDLSQGDTISKIEIALDGKASLMSSGTVYATTGENSAKVNYATITLDDENNKLVLTPTGDYANAVGESGNVTVTIPADTYSAVNCKGTDAGNSDITLTLKFKAAPKPMFGEGKVTGSVQAYDANAATDNKELAEIAAAGNTLTVPVQQGDKLTSLAIPLNIAAGVEAEAGRVYAASSEWAKAENAEAVGSFTIADKVLTVSFTEGYDFKASADQYMIIEANAIKSNAVTDVKNEVLKITFDVTALEAPGLASIKVTAGEEKTLEETEGKLQLAVDMGTAVTKFSIALDKKVEKKAGATGKLNISFKDLSGTAVESKAKSLEYALGGDGKSVEVTLKDFKADEPGTYEVTLPAGELVTNNTSDKVNTAITFYINVNNAALTGSVLIKVSGGEDAVKEAKYGDTLVASLGSYKVGEVDTPSNNTGTLTYKWKYSDGTEVSSDKITTNGEKSAATSSYTIQAADVGKKITVEISSSVQSGILSLSSENFVEAKPVELSVVMEDGANISKKYDGDAKISIKNTDVKLSGSPVDGDTIEASTDDEGNSVAATLTLSGTIEGEFADKAADGQNAAVAPKNVGTEKPITIADGVNFTLNGTNSQGYVLKEIESDALKGKIEAADQELTILEETIYVKNGDTVTLDTLKANVQTNATGSDGKEDKSVLKFSKDSAEISADFTVSAETTISVSASATEDGNYGAATAKTFTIKVAEKPIPTISFGTISEDTFTEDTNANAGEKSVEYGAEKKDWLLDVQAKYMKDENTEETIGNADIKISFEPEAGDNAVIKNTGTAEAPSYTLNKVGTVKITATVGSGDSAYQTVSKSYVLSVTPKKITIDQAWTALAGSETEDAKEKTYSGEEQTILTITSSSDYTISGDKGTNAGEYTLTATLSDKNNTEWSDGGTADKTIKWTIKKAAATVLDEQKAKLAALKGISPASAGGADGYITGTEATMEYSTDPNFDATKTSDCKATKTESLTAGDYYVRYKVTDTNHTAPVYNSEVTDGSNGVVKVTVPAYTAITVVYDLNNQYVSTDTINSVSTSAGREITLVTPNGITDGYTFGGWYYDQTLTSSAGAAGATLVIDAGKATNNKITLYAKWTIRDLSGTVTITGDKEYGKTLTASTSISNAVGTLKYQWKRGNDVISDAESSTYTLTSADIGKVINVVVYTDAQKVAATTGKIESTNSDTVAKKALTVTATPEEITYDGKTKEAKVTFAIADGGVINNDTVTLSPTEATVVYADADAGDSKTGASYKNAVTLTLTAGGDYYTVDTPDATSITGKISKADRTLTAGSINAAKGESITADKIKTAVGADSSATIKVKDAEGQDVSGATITAGNTAGTTIYQVYAEGDSNYNISNTVNLKLIVNSLGTQTLTIGSPTVTGLTSGTDYTWNNNKLTISKEKGSTVVSGGLTVPVTVAYDPDYGTFGEISYTSSSDIITIDNNGKITAVGNNGTATVTIKAAATSTHNEASVTFDVEVTAAAAAPTLSPSSSTFTGEKITVTPSTDDAYELVSGSSTLEAYAPATYDVVFKLNGGYTWSGGDTADKTVTWTISQASSAIAPSGVSGGTLSIGDLNSQLKYAYRLKTNESTGDWTEVAENSTSVSVSAAGTYEVKFSDEYFTSSANTSFAEVIVNPASGGGTPSTPIALTGISVTPATAKVEVGKSVTLTSALVPADTTETPTVTWSSSDTSIATVANGTVTGVKAGSVTITAKVTNEAGTELSATATVEVVDELKPVTAISLSPASAVVEEKGSTSLSVVYTPVDQNENPEVSWSSADSTIATVNDGVVTGVKAGSTTITATVTGENGTLTATASITVTEKIVPVESFSVSPTSVTLAKGSNVSISTSILPADASDTNITWSSGNSAIATVSGGTVTGVGVGVTSISAKLGEHTAAVIVTVTDAAAAGDDVVSTEEEEDIDLSDLIKDTEDGEKLAEVINDVVTVTTDAETGESKVETKIWVGGLESSYTYTGSAIKPTVHVYDGVKQLGSSDYSVSYKNNKNAGTGEITVKFKGNYASTPQTSLSFTIAPANLSTDFTAEDLTVYTNKGKAVKAVPTVVWTSTGKALAKSNYKISYKKGGSAVSSITEAGDYTAVIETANSNFTGSTGATISVIEKADKARDLSKGKIKLDFTKATWTGKEIKPGVTVTDADGKSVASDRYTLEYLNNVNVGKATVIVSASDVSEDGYVGSKSATFSIAKGKGDSKISVTAADATYTPAGAKPVLSVLDEETGEYLSAGTDYTVSVKKNKAATGTAKTAEYTVKGKGNYKFTKTGTYAIAKADISGAVVTIADVTNANKWNSPKVSVSYAGKKLGTGEYSVTINSTAVPADGIVSVTIAAKDSGNFTGSKTATYKVITKDKDISKAKAGKIDNQTYTGSAIVLSESALSGKLTLSGTALKYGTDYKATAYSKNIKKGTAKVTLSGTGEYGGSKTLSFKIVQKKGAWNQSGKSFVDGVWTNK